MGCWRAFSFFFILIFLSTVSGMPEGVSGEGYTIRGIIHFQGGPEDIYIALTTREHFGKQADEFGKAALETGETAFTIITPNEQQLKTGRLKFRFDSVPEGEYGIQAFQDKNGDGRLNSGLFGPAEPWGMSFRGSRPRFRPPGFNDIAFQVTDHTDTGIIVLK